MNRADKIARLQAKAADLQQWFEGRKLPEGPVQINRWATVTDINKYLRIIKNTFEAYHNNPMAAPYVAAYFQLMDLKKYLENEP